jgi:flavorubredoxin
MPDMSSSVIEVSSSVHWVGVRHPDLQFFDDLFPTHNGTTYNSYLVRGRDKTVLIDSVKEKFSDEFFANIEQILPVSSIDAIVVNHTEPDHSGALGRLVEMNPEMVIYCSRPAANFLKQLLHKPLNIEVVEDGQEIDLGGKTLRFISAPFLHWPDTIFTYLVEEKMLFSCDAFGAHYCPKGHIFDDQIADFSADFHVYFDSIMRPFKDKIREALSRIEGLEIVMVCPSHGPIRRLTHADAIHAYRRWSAPPPAEEKPKAVMAILSSHGNTRRLGGVIRETLESRGFDVQEFALCGMRDDDFRDALEQADVVLFGSPTIQRDAPPHVWHALSLLSTVTLKSRLAAVFGSFGWSGEAAGMIETRLAGLKFKLAAETLTCRFTPTEEVLEASRLFAGQVADKVLGEG